MCDVLSVSYQMKDWLGLTLQSLFVKAIDIAKTNEVKFDQTRCVKFVSWGWYFSECKINLLLYVRHTQTIHQQLQELTHYKLRNKVSDKNLSVTRRTRTSRTESNNSTTCGIVMSFGRLIPWTIQRTDSAKIL